MFILLFLKYKWKPFRYLFFYLSKTGLDHSTITKSLMACDIGELVYSSVQFAFIVWQA